MPRTQPLLPAPREPPTRLPDQPREPPLISPHCQLRRRRRRLRSLATPRGMTTSTNKRRLQRGAAPSSIVPLSSLAVILPHHTRCQHNALLHRDRTARCRAVCHSAPGAVPCFATSAAAVAITTAIGSGGVAATHAVAAGAVPSIMTAAGTAGAVATHAVRRTLWSLALPLQMLQPGRRHDGIVARECLAPTATGATSGATSGATTTADVVHALVTMSWQRSSSRCITRLSVHCVTAPRPAIVASSPPVMLPPALLPPATPASARLSPVMTSSVWLFLVRQ